MRTFEEIRENFRLGEAEEDMLHRLAPLVEPQADQIVEDFYQFLLEIPDAAKFLQDPERLTSKACTAPGSSNCLRAPTTHPTFSVCSASVWHTCASACRPISSMWP
jgi:hypothetical protein